MLKITKGHEPLPINQTVIVIYGEPDAGKTSLAFSANKSLLLDFDNGAKRSGFRGDSVQITSWQDVASMSADDLTEYDTICVDTVGKLLDKLAAHLISTNSKLGRTTGQLSMQGYGALKVSFQSWMNNLQTMGKDVVLLAHSKEDKDGDYTVVRPDVMGSSLDFVKQLADGIGYLYFEGGKRTLQFNTTDKSVGKNPAQFDKITVPHLTTEPRYLASLIDQTKEKIGAISAEHAEVAKTVDEWRVTVNDAQTAESVNDLISKAKEFDGIVKKQCSAILNKRAIDLGLEYSKEDAAYIVKVKDAA